MDNTNELSSSLSFASSSYLSNGSSLHDHHSSTGYEPGPSPEFLSLRKISSSLEKLLADAEYDYSDAEIVVEGISVGVHQCILASRSTFFHELFQKKSDSSLKEGKPRYVLHEVVPYGKIGYEAFTIFLNYLYTGKLKPSPPEVSICVDDSCSHDACFPAINYALELMYASAIFQMKELVMLVQRRLINFVDKASVEDVVPILVAAVHCQLNQLRSHCIQRVARSDLDNISLEKELPHEIATEIKSLRLDSSRQFLEEAAESTDYNKRIRRIHKALDSDDVELMKLLLLESNVTLDGACALHYAAAYCDSKVVNEVLSLSMADLNLKNSRGYTALHLAARRKEPSILMGLLNNGASVSETTWDGQLAVTISRRLTRAKDYNEAMEQGKESNKDRICIDVLDREMRRNPLAGNVSTSTVVVADDLIMKLLFLENRVAIARVLFPREARLAMEIAHAESTSEFAGLSASKGSSGNIREVDLNELPSDQIRRLKARFQALQKTVETGRRFFPKCSEVLDKFLEDDMNDALCLEKGSPEEQRTKKMRYMELKEDVMKAFHKDRAENKWGAMSSSSSSSLSPMTSSSCAPKASVHHKVRKR